MVLRQFCLLILSVIEPVPEDRPILCIVWHSFKMCSRTLNYER